MVIYESANQYLASCQTVRAQLAAIDQIIAGLLATAIASVGQADISEYWLNDGQTQIKCVYKGVDQIYTSINAFRKLRNQIAQDRFGRMTRLVDSKNFPNNGFF